MKDIYSFFPMKRISYLLLLYLFISGSAYSQIPDSLPQKTKDILNSLQKKKLFKPGNSQRVNPKDFYPLQVGNYWEYECYDPGGGYLDFKQYNYVIGDTIMPNEKKYFIIEEINVHGRTWPYYVPPWILKVHWYKRKDDSGNVYHFNKNPQCDRIADKLNGKIGEVYLSWKWFSSRCDTSWNFGIIMDTGISKGISWKYILQLDNPTLPSSLFESKEYFYDKIGPAVIKQEYTYYYLAGAIIGKDTLGIITSINESLSEISKEYILFQNFPNPFNSNTLIRYKLNKEARIRLAINDILGREMKVLVLKNEIPGDYNVEWNGKNSFNNNVTSGIYFYRLEVIPSNRDPPFFETRKMIMIR